MKKITWQEAVNEFYQLKRIYDDEKQRGKQKILANQNKSTEQKKEAFRKLNQKCVDCGKPMGTTFAVTYDEKKGGRYLTAICGDKVSPCGLNIKIFCGNTETYSSLIHMLEKDIETVKNKIIDEKNKLLFGFITSEAAVEVFDNYKKDLAELTERLASLLELYTLETDNRETKEAIYKVQEEICKDIYLVKEAMKKFDIDSNLQYVKDAVDIYKHRISTKLNQLAHLEYASQDVAYDEETGDHVLIKRKTNIASLEIVMQDNKVIAFDFKKVSKTTPLEVQEVLLSKEDVLTIANDIVKEKKEKESTEASDKEKEETLFSLNEDGQVIWEKPEYKTIWEDDLTKLVKQTLIQDPVWMEAAMKHFVENKSEGKSLELIMPPSLIIPPKELSDGTYDLGNEFFNQLYVDHKNELNVDEDQMREKLLNIAKQTLHF